MSRIIEVPAQTIRQEIRQIEEFLATPTTPAVVRVHVGRVDDKGSFVMPQNFEIFEIRGAYLDALNGPPGAWAPDKPEGTYRNEDLWYFVDRIRDLNKRAEDLQREANQV